MTFTLRRIIWEDGRPSLDPEDYSVTVDGKDVGRRSIARAAPAPRSSGYGQSTAAAARSPTAARTPRRPFAKPGMRANLVLWLSPQKSERPNASPQIQGRRDRHHYRAAMNRNMPGGTYEVIRQMPETGGEFEYRVKSMNGVHEHIARESELIKT